VDTEITEEREALAERNTVADGPITEGGGTRSSRRTWVSVLVAAVIIVGILAATAIGGTAFFFYRHIQSEPVPSDTAAAEQFAEARKRFADQKPLIEMRRGEEPVLHREFIGNPTASKPLETLRVLAYDPDSGKLVRVAIPMWLLRLAPGGKRMSFLNDNGIDFDSERVHLTLEDLERRGPGLLLDHADRRGSLVLVWTE